MLIFQLHYLKKKIQHLKNDLEKEKLPQADNIVVKLIF